MGEEHHNIYSLSHHSIMRTLSLVILFILLRNNLYTVSLMQASSRLATAFVRIMAYYLLRGLRLLLEHAEEVMCAGLPPPNLFNHTCLVCQPSISTATDICKVTTLRRLVHHYGLRLWLWLELMWGETRLTTISYN